MTIGEICQKLSLSETTLRYYERQGVLYRIPRIGGRRDYSEKDYHRLQEILQLRRVGVPLKRSVIILPWWIREGRQPSCAGRCCSSSATRW